MRNTHTSAIAAYVIVFTKLYPSWVWIGSTKYLYKKSFMFFCMRKLRKGFINSAVRYSISRLLSEAKENSKSHPERMRRYLQLVRKFQQRYRHRLKRQQALQFCKKCFTYWIPGETVKVRAYSEKKLLCYECLNCGFKKKIGYSKPTNARPSRSD